MPGKLLPKTWEFNPTLDAPGKYRRACRYDAFVPVELAALDLKLSSSVAGVVSDAEHAIRELNIVPANDLQAIALVEPQAADQLFALAAEHAAGDDFDPAVCAAARAESVVHGCLALDFRRGLDIHRFPY